MIPRSIPVGMYHHVNHHAGDFITVSVENFRRQMEWLKREHYETLTAEKFLAALRGEYQPAPRSFVITFDDAWLDIYTFAFPILRELGHHFIVFAISNWTDRASEHPFQPTADTAFPTHEAASKRIKEKRAHEVICSWEHLREMQASGLCSIENHSATHRHATQLAPETLREDLLRCGDAIRDQLGRDSRHLCWPRGSHNAQTLAVAKELGLATTYLVRRGVNLVGGNSFAVKRFTVDDRDEAWLAKQLRIFSNPVLGLLYARLKPDRWFRSSAKDAKK